MARNRKKLLILLLIAVLGLVFLVLEPGCPVRRLTGVPCPGCGMSRAWLAVLRLDLTGAVSYHPMFWALPMAAWLGWTEFRPFRKPWKNIAVTAAMVLGLLVCYGVRLHFNLIP